MNFRKAILTSAVLLAALTIAVVVAVILPVIKDIQKMREQTKNVLAYIEQKNAEAKQFAASKSKVDEIKNDVLALEDKLFYTGDELSLITALEGAAAKNNLVQKIESSQLNKKPGERISMGILVNGRYGDAINYLNDLENFRYVLDIRKVVFTPQAEPAGGTAEDEVDLRINFNLYVNK